MPTFTVPKGTQIKTKTVGSKGYIYTMFSAVDSDGQLCGSCEAFGDHVESLTAAMNSGEKVTAEKFAYNDERGRWDVELPKPKKGGGGNWGGGGGKAGYKGNPIPLEAYLTTGAAVAERTAHALRAACGDVNPDVLAGAVAVAMGHFWAMVEGNVVAPSPAGTAQSRPAGQKQQPQQEQQTSRGGAAAPQQSKATATGASSTGGAGGAMATDGQVALLERAADRAGVQGNDFTRWLADQGLTRTAIPVAKLQQLNSDLRSMGAP